MVSLAAIVIGALVPTARAEHESDEGALARRWVRDGYFEGWAVRAADLDGDGSDEVIYGGRGIAALDEGAFSTHVPLWSVKWNHDPNNVLSGGDNGWVTGMEFVEATGDAIPDALVTTENTDAYLIDGADGSKRWYIPRLVGGLSFGFALFDGDRDEIPDLFPTGGSVAISGATGETLWSAPIPKHARVVASGDLDSESGRDIAIGITPPGAGTNPNTIVPALTATTVFAVSSNGELLYDFKPVSAVTSIATADVTGDGTDEVVVGTFNGIIYVIGTAGLRWTVVIGPGPIRSIATADSDGDGRDEIFASHSYLDEHSAVGLSPTGATLWRHVVATPVEVVQIAELDGDAPPELLVGAGTSADGIALALNTEIVAPRELWRVDTVKRVKSFAVATQSDRTRVAIGSDEGLLRVVDSVTGALVWDYVAGGYLKSIAAADLDDDGLDEVISGDQEGFVVASDTDGTERWATRADVGSQGLIMELDTGDVDGDGSVEVAAVGERLFQSNERGVVELYSANGTRRWSTLLAGFADEVVIADLDGDGRKEIVVAEGRDDSGTCGVAALDSSTGEVLWRTDLFGCLVPHIDVGDIDGDGRPEIGYGEQVLFGTRHVALLEHDGAIRWTKEVVRETTWIEMVAGGIVHGGFATESRGFVARREGTAGEVVWETFLPDSNDLGGASRYGIIIGDRLGDFRIAASSDAGDVHLLDGTSGARQWATRLEPAGLQFNQRHQAGPVAYVSGTEDHPPVLFAAQYAFARKRSKSFALTMDGTIVGSIPMEGDAEAAAPARFEEGVAGAAVGAGLGVYALDVALPAPEPSGSSTTVPSVAPTASPSDPSTSSPMPDPTAHPGPQQTSVTFTDRSATAGQYSDETLFEARLSDSDGRPITGADLTFELTGSGSTRAFSAISDNDGVASVTPVLDENPGPHQLTVRFAGDNAHRPSSNTTAFVVDKEDTNLDLAVDGRGSNRTLTARLADRDAPSDGIGGRTIDFYADGELIGWAATNDNGVATMKPPPRYRGGKYDFEARFEGDDYYRASLDGTRT